MSDSKDNTLQWLKELGLTGDEAVLYTELLKGPQTHLELARATGINRTKVYRLADELEKRSLIATHSDDTGTALIASDPATFEIELVNKEEALKRQRTIFKHVLPELHKLQHKGKTDFEVNTYQGVQGFKQMLWHELKAKGELLVLGKSTIEQLVENVRWAEKHRALTVEANYAVRQIINSDEVLDPFTRNQEFMDSHYEERLIGGEVLPMRQTISIYNNTVAVYHWRTGDKVGVEIVGKMYVAMMREIFEYYWRLADIHKRPVRL